MTEEANGPEGATASADNRADATVIPDQGSNGESGPKLAGPLNEDNRATVEAKKWAGEDGSIDLNKIVEGYKNLETHASKSLKVPGEDATDEDWNKFYSNLGRPEKPDGYEFQLNREALPEEFPYDEKSATEFRNWAHEAGLTPKQAQMLHDKFVGYQAGNFTAMTEHRQKAEGDAHRAIVDEWGGTESEGYKRNVELASRSIHQLGLTDAFKEGGLLSKDGAILNAKAAFAMAKVGKELYAEDSMAMSSSGLAANPFSEGPHFNRSKQGELIRNDPQRAKAMILSAGRNPSEYGLG